MSLAELGATAEEAELVSAIVEQVERFGAERLRARAIDRDKRIPADVTRDLAELGLFGMSLPESYGGAGLSLHAVGSVLAALARHDRSVATLVGLHAGLGTRGLVAFGGRLAARYLPELASGAKIAAFSATEAEAGSDLAAVRTTATVVHDRLRIDGSKVYVTNAGIADVFTVLVSSPGLGGARRGQSLVLFERGDAGFTVGEEEDKLGLRGSSTASLYFDEVDLPFDRVIGEPGRGKPQVEHVLGFGRIAMAAGCVGAARAALAQARAHVATRKQFGRALIAFDVVAEQLATMEALHFAMESLVRWASDAVDDPEAFMRRSLAAKVFASEAGWEIADQALQLHGGGGFIEEGGIPLLLRDARVTRIFEGANDVLLTRLGTLEVGPRPAPRTRLEHGAADGLEANLRDQAEALTRAHGIKVLRRQRDLHRLGKISVWRHALDAAVLRAREAGTPEDPRLVHASALANWRTAPDLSPCPELPSLASTRERAMAEASR